MMRYKKPFGLRLIFGWLALFCFGFSGGVQAASLNVRVQDSLVDLHAEQVPLINVLESITKKADILFESNHPLTEPVSLDLKNIPVEECVRRLLTERNYSLIFKKTGKNSFVLTEIRVLGSDSGAGFRSRPVARIEAKNNRRPEPPPQIASEPPVIPQDPFKRYEKSCRI